jgi:MFS family permease
LSRVFTRNVPLLALCQAMMVSSMSLIVSTSALVGYNLASDKSYATAPLAVGLVATMLASIPAALWMQRIGRKAGFMIASVVGFSGAGLLALSILEHLFWLFVAASALIGIFNAFGNYYRFTAADAVDDAHKSRAISLVLAGGVIAAVVGPNLANLTKTLIPDAEFAASYAFVMIFFLFSLVFQGFLKLPNKVDLLHTGESGVARPLREIMRQPKFVVAVICGMLGYGVMTFVMTATPLAMQHRHMPFSDTAFVIQWHVLGMFVPSFFTGHLINRFGVKKIMFLGALIGLACAAINVIGSTATHFFYGLLLLGISWNFLFVGATALLTEVYTPAEQFKTQAINDFVVFTVVAVASLSAGAINHGYGWKVINYSVIPLYLIVLASILLLKRAERRQPVDPVVVVS